MTGWMDPVLRVFAAMQDGAGLLVCAGDYRPELFEALALRLHVAFRDFRRECMATRGWRATQVTLAELDRFLEEACRDGGALVHNVEALLATRPEIERAVWFARFLERRWPGRVVVPVVLFETEVPADAGRVVRLDASTLPPSTLLMRLASQR